MYRNACINILIFTKKIHRLPTVTPRKHGIDIYLFIVCLMRQPRIHENLFTMKNQNFTDIAMP